MKPREVVLDPLFNNNPISLHRSAHVTAHIQHLFAAAGLGDNLIFIHDETIACR